MQTRRTYAAHVAKLNTMELNIMGLNSGNSSQISHPKKGARMLTNVDIQAAFEQRCA